MSIPRVYFSFITIRVFLCCVKHKKDQQRRAPLKELFNEFIFEKKAQNNKITNVTGSVLIVPVHKWQWNVLPSISSNTGLSRIQHLQDNCWCQGAQEILHFSLSPMNRLKNLACNSYVFILVLLLSRDHFEVPITEQIEHKHVDRKQSTMKLI